MLQIPDCAKVFLYEDLFTQMCKTKMPFVTEQVLYRKIEKHFNPIEGELAAQSHRPSGDIHIQRGLSLLEQAAQSSSRKPSNACQENPLAYYDAMLNQYDIYITQGKTGLHLLSSFYHEAEHAAQVRGDTYNTTQKKLMLIGAMFYPEQQTNETKQSAHQTIVEYQNNYQELYARITEARFCVAAYYELLQNRPQQLTKDETVMLMFDSVAKSLLEDVSHENALAMNARHIQLLQNGVCNVESFTNVFVPELHISQAEAIEFLQTTAPRLYAAAMQEAQAVHQRLSDIVETLKDKLAANEEQARQVRQTQQTQNIINTATRLNIPVIYTTPNDVPLGRTPLPASKLEEVLTQSILPRYNCVVVVEQGQPPLLMFDYNPTPRPYSTDPVLQAQWYAEHPDEPPDVSYEEQGEPWLDDDDVR